MSKWYVGLEGHEIASQLKAWANEVLFSYKVDPVNISDRLYNEYESKHYEVRSKILEIRSEYYLYNKEVYQAWTDTLIQMDTVKSRLDEEIDNLFSAAIINF